jgi:MoaA/NifB/PqqE/SkfB family radical SAM enzyme
MFPLKTKVNLAKGILLRTNPLYVQFYITARCNLTCEQCNIIYANSDVRECTLEEIERIAENLGKIGVAIVLLTGGEPFVRKDLPEIVRAFVRNGIHVRMQTNGLATEDMLAKCVEAGGCDISISLDSLRPDLQDRINGGFPGSWHRAMDTIAKVTRHLPKDSFAAFGCVLTPWNIDDVEEVVRFGTEIGWYTSLVPIHVTPKHRPMNFRTYDPKLAFKPEHYPAVDALIDRLKALKHQSFLLYDSDEYLDDVRRFVRDEPIQWRRKNDQVCDSPGMYFAILPNGEMAVCCDWRLPGTPVRVYDADYPELYRQKALRERVTAVAGACGGCMFGSYPEITISARYWSGTLERMRTFFGRPAPREWPLSTETLEQVARSVRTADPAHA